MQNRQHLEALTGLTPEVTERAVRDYQKEKVPYTDSILSSSGSPNLRRERNASTASPAGGGIDTAYFRNEAGSFSSAKSYTSGSSGKSRPSGKQVRKS